MWVSYDQMDLVASGFSSWKAGTLKLVPESTLVLSGPHALW